LQGSLGEKIGEGTFSDVHAWAPGQVVKLFKSGFPHRFGSHEARATRAVFAAGVPAPAVFGEVNVEGRFGIVLSRFDGPTLRQLLRSGTVSPAEAGAILASLYRSIHKTPPPDVLSLRDWLDAMQLLGGSVPRHIAAGIFTLFERLPPGGGLCHADLHPGNVIMTADGPRVVDWIGAVRAPAAFDLATSHLALSGSYNAVAQREYARLAGMSLAALVAMMQSYLPIACAISIHWGAGGARERLIQRIEAALGSKT
jgi:aminoglycoside phosphotransferase (APT) family kinase protein